MPEEGIDRTTAIGFSLSLIFLSPLAEQAFSAANTTIIKEMYKICLVIVILFEVLLFADH
jgi:hypothetical protein